jgi:hypothetical protein
MDRRAFLGTLASGLLAAPLAAETQQAGSIEQVRAMPLRRHRGDGDADSGRGPEKRPWHPEVYRAALLERDDHVESALLRLEDHQPSGVAPQPYVNRILKGGTTRRPAADQVRSGDQPQDRQGPRPDDPAVAPAAGGSGDRVKSRCSPLRRNGPAACVARRVLCGN